MTRVLVCGASLSAAVAALGLEPVDARPHVVLLDLSDRRALGPAAAVDLDVPRIVVCEGDDEALVRAIGSRAAVARSADAAVLGPLVASALPAPDRRRTSLVVITSASGGAGRTLLAVNLALRLAARSRVVLLDATGSGAANWWLGLSSSPWSDLEGLADELTAEHLAIVAAERDGVRLIGGPPRAPSDGLLSAAVRSAMALADLVIVDAPIALEPRTQLLRGLADRVVVLAPQDPSARAGLDEILDERAWLIATRCRAERIGGRDVLRSLPDDPAAIRAAASGPSAVGGELGRAYDAIAELLAIDASA